MKKKVAIFEDDAVSCLMHERMFRLQAEHLEVHVFDQPEHGYHQLEKGGFDIIVIEVHFWKCFGGLDILHEIKKRTNAPMYFLGVTSLLRQSDVTFLTEAGFNECIERPVMLPEIPVFAKAS